MPLYPQEISKYLLEKQNPSPPNNLKKTIEYLFIDCRIKKNGLLPSSMEIPPTILENLEV